MSLKPGKSSQSTLSHFLNNPTPSSSSQLTNMSDSETDDCSNAETLNIAHHLTRYIILNIANKQIFHRHELQKVYNEVGKAKFNDVLEEVEDILENIYGLQLQVLDKKLKNPSYLVRNALDNNNLLAKKGNNDEQELDSNRILLFLVLAHIFMSDCPVSKKSLFEFLAALKIDVDNVDPTFGDIKDIINNYMVKTRYVTSNTDPVNKKVTYSWGPRAEIEISKKTVLDLVCKIYGVEPKNFAQQLQKVDQQDFDEL